MASEIVGVAWMLDKEKGSHMLQGGILADEMGLGWVLCRYVGRPGYPADCHWTGKLFK
jgi:hypothetical protein